MYSENHYELVSAKKAAQMLGLSPNTLTVWRSTGRYNLPYVKFGHRVMYKMKDVQQFIEAHTRA